MGTGTLVILVDCEEDEDKDEIIRAVNKLLNEMSADIYIGWRFFADSTTE